jgi:hypothetical protein
MTLGSTQPLTEMSNRSISWGVRRPVRTTDNLTTFTCRLSRNLGASTSWNPKGLSRPVMGLLYLYLIIIIIIICIWVGKLHRTVGLRTEIRTCGLLSKQQQFCHSIAM